MINLLSDAAAEEFIGRGAGTWGPQCTSRK